MRFHSPFITIGALVDSLAEITGAVFIGGRRNLEGDPGSYGGAECSCCVLGGVGGGSGGDER